MSGRYMHLYMTEETKADFESVRKLWGLTGERQQGQVIARALRMAVEAEGRKKK